MTTYEKWNVYCVIIKTTHKRNYCIMYDVLQVYINLKWMLHCNCMANATASNNGMLNEPFVLKQTFIMYLLYTDWILHN